MLTRCLRFRGFVLALCALWLLVGCAVQQATLAYSEGRYLDSVRKTVSYLDQRGTLPDASDSEKLFGIVRNVVAHYEAELAQTVSTDRAGRIAALDALWQLRVLLDGKFYDEQVAFFTGKYTVEGLALQVAEQFYLSAQEIPIHSKEDFLARAQAYGNALKYHAYKDAAEQRDTNTRLYWQGVAEEHYLRGKDAIAAKNYRLASEELGEALSAYAAYGSYKDSQVLYDKYDRIYRSDESRRLYQQAKEVLKTARLKSDYRMVAADFQRAYDIHAKYGELNDARAQAETWRARGVVTVALRSDDVGLEYDVKNWLGQSYVRWVNDGAADVKLNLRWQDRYDERRNDRSVTAMSENVKSRAQRTKPDGTVEWYDAYTLYRFNKVREISENWLELRLDIDATGQYRYRNTLTETEGSRRVEEYYTGEVPSNYRRRSEGNWDRREELIDRARAHIWERLHGDIDEIGAGLARL
ncbi:hypothetical protein [Chitiniphilus eburneus]|uniref:Tetratricopeptide repeat protein n=1 Tax=Chitiniphilus eburneus TaxID=2571148 RepID=A0A4U0QS28_9NEIS|nr:hypothetical protein [Chitiniphilus eburneus]TJZ79044.1 hypothetical protein FAZ21_01810 [Chitiniphilus eburneus]